MLHITNQKKNQRFYYYLQLQTIYRGFSCVLLLCCCLPLLRHREIILPPSSLLFKTFHFSYFCVCLTLGLRSTWLLCRKMSSGTNNNWNKIPTFLRRLLLPRELAAVEIAWVAFRSPSGGTLRFADTRKKTSSKRCSYPSPQSWFVFLNIVLSALPAFAFIMSLETFPPHRHFRRL